MGAALLEGKSNPVGEGSDDGLGLGVRDEEHAVQANSVTAGLARIARPAIMEAMRPACLILALLLVGCAEPRSRGSSGMLEPPPARSGTPLSREAALSIAKQPDPELAIESLDEQRIGFALDAPTLEWFRQQGAPSEVLDYLSKRARVDWEGLRGDIDSRTPAGEYADPRRGFDDFAGTARKDSLDTAPRSEDPFNAPKH